MNSCHRNFRFLRQISEHLHLKVNVYWIQLCGVRLEVFTATKSDKSPLNLVKTSSKVIGGFYQTLQALVVR